MKLLISLLICLIGPYGSYNEPTVEDLRRLFYAAERNQAAFKKLTVTVAEIDNESAPVLICYKGVSEMLAAKYTLSPITKLNKFRKGKRLIEAAIKLDPRQLESRFLRFSIQTNLPGFLSYDGAIAEDKEMLLKQVAHISDKDLKNKVIRYLSSSKYCTEEEKKSIQK